MLFVTNGREFFRDLEVSESDYAEMHLALHTIGLVQWSKHLRFGPAHICEMCGTGREKIRY
jgi:hypothetical protein